MYLQYLQDATWMNHSVILFCFEEVISLFVVGYIFVQCTPTIRYIMGGNYEISCLDEGVLVQSDFFGSSH